MLAKLSITGLTGPERPVTTHFVDVKEVKFDFNHNVVTVSHGMGVSEFALDDVTSVMDKIELGEHSITIG